MVNLPAPTFAQTYAQCGFALFDTYEKKPCSQGWQHSPINIDFKPGREYGIVCRATDFILDYDKRRDPGAGTPDNQLAKLWELLDLPKLDTFVVKTGNGYHIYFSKPDDVHVKTIVPGFPAIEIKSKGRYVIGVGSKHPSGATYKPERRTIEEIQPVPEKLLSHCVGVERVIDPKAIIVCDSKATQKRYIKYLSLDSTRSTGAYKVACEGCNYGLPPERVLELMLAHYNDHRLSGPRTPEELEEKIDHATRFAQETQGSKHPWADFGEPDDDDSGKPKYSARWDKSDSNKRLVGNLNNVLNCFRVDEWLKDDTDISTAYPNPLFEILKFNLFSHQVEYTRRAPWHSSSRPIPPCWGPDADEEMQKDYIARTKFIDAPVGIHREAVKVYSRENQYHPIIDWLESIKWDGKPRLDRLLISYAGCADSPYVREVGTNTIMALVARIMEPGCQHDHMLILEGKPGIGKSSFIRILGGEWYADIKIDLSSEAATTKTAHLMQGSWILEASELEFFRRTEVSSLKRFMTVAVDKVRLPYEHHPSQFPRQSGFIGTVNPGPDGYFKDTTGNRRFWPVYCTQFDLPGLKRDRDQIFAEALHRHKQGEAHYITDESLNTSAETEQQKRMEIDSWTNTIEEWATDKPLGPVTTDQLAFQCLNIAPARYSRNDKLRIAQIMRTLKYELVRNGRLWVWQQSAALESVKEWL